MCAISRNEKPRLASLRYSHRALVGSLWAIGLIAAPTLFSVLSDNTQLAGLLAGKMFTLTAYVGMACAFYAC